MIPKIIHFCWLSGDPYPDNIEKCISTWKQYLPDYEIMLWDTKRFDVNSTQWTKQAFEKKKYAFVADYIRLFAVYNYGGIYLDSDVQVLKSFDDLLNLPYFIGRESHENVPEVAAFGAEPGCGWIKDCLDYYENSQFITSYGRMNLKTMPQVVRDLIEGKYVWNPIESVNEYNMDTSVFNVFPISWFNAHPGDERGAVYTVDKSTYSIHHYAHSWTKCPVGPLHRLYYKIMGIDWRTVKRYNYSPFHLVFPKENE